MRTSMSRRYHAVCQALLGEEIEMRSQPAQASAHQKRKKESLDTVFDPSAKIYRSARAPRLPP